MSRPIVTCITGTFLGQIGLAALVSRSSRGRSTIGRRFCRLVAQCPGWSGRKRVRLPGKLTPTTSVFWNQRLSYDCGQAFEE